MPTPPPAGAAPPAPLLDRELAILQFNRRVLAQASRPDVPLLEQLRYLTIVSSNLDEFFEVRGHDHLQAAGQPGTGAAFRAVADAAHALICRAVRAVQRRADAGAAVRRHPHRQPRAAHALAAPLGGRVLPAPGPAPAGAGEPGPLAPVPSGRQQVPELHRPPGRARRLRAREPDRDRQGAARAAARDPPARRAVCRAARASCC
jgi:hypothetical protein